MTASDAEQFVLDETDEELRSWVKSELASGEQLLWAARRRPRPLSNRMRAAYLRRFVVLAGVSFVSLAFVFVRPLAVEVGWLLAFGITSSIVAFFTGMAWMNRRRVAFENANTFYALTDRRSIFWQPGSEPESIKVYSVFRAEVVRVHRVEFPDGSGDVRFILKDPRGLYERGRDEGFTQIEDVRRVEELVRRTLVAAD